MLRSLTVAILAVFVIAGALAASAGDPYSPAGLGAGCTSAYYQTRANCSASPAAILKHVPNASYVGNDIAGTDGGVKQAQIRANVSYAMNAAVGNGAGRSVSVGDHCVTVCAINYFDFMRPNAAATPQFGYVMLSDPLANPDAATHAWLLHLGSPPPMPSNRASPGTNIYVDNFKEPQTATWWRLCFDGEVSAADTHSVTCNGLSPTPGPTSSTGDQGGNQSYDAGDIVFSDTSSIGIANLTNSLDNTSQEISSDSDLLSAESTWFPVALEHRNGSIYPVWINGVSRGANNSITAGHGSCDLVLRADCLMLGGLPNVIAGDFEFFGQSGNPGSIVYNDSLLPFAVNSAANILSAGQSIVELEEYESGTFPTNPPIGTYANTMLSYYASYLLTWQPNNPAAEISWLDVDLHDPSQNSKHLSSWPIQTLVPYGTVAISITPYSPGGGPTFGIDGCVTGETDSGGIIPYLVPGSCGVAFDGVTKAGVYANASSACAVAGSPIGPCAWFVNITNASYTIPCSIIASLGRDLGLTLTFGHWIGIGQTPNPGGSASGIFGDVIPASQGGGGGTLTTADTTNATFNCGSGTLGVLSSGAGAIVVK